VALEDTVVSRLHKDKFHDLILAQPEIALELAAILSERLNEFSEEG
jgi:CRP-like cAMP-binding protein